MRRVRRTLLSLAILLGGSTAAFAQCGLNTGGFVGHTAPPGGGVVRIDLRTQGPGCGGIVPEARLTDGAFGTNLIAWAATESIVRDTVDPSLWVWRISVNPNFTSATRVGFANIRFLTADGAPATIGTWFGFTQTAAPAGRLPLLRYNNGRADTLDHFYNSRFTEIGCGAGGWWYEGTIGELLDREQTGTAALYRFWHPGLGDHFYTLHPEEASEGYQQEGYVGYLFTSAVNGTIPLFRWYAGSPVFDHLYTTNPNEQPASYTPEGIVGWVYPPPVQETCDRVDLTLSDVTPVQVVYDVPLVKDKKTAYRVEVTASDCIRIGAVTVGPIDVAVVQDGVRYASSLTYSDFNIRDTGRCSAFAHVLASNGPEHDTPTVIEASVDANHYVNEGNWSNNGGSLTVSTRRTRGMSVLYVPFLNSGMFSAPTEQLRTSELAGFIADSNSFIRSQYPVAEDAFQSYVAPVFLTGSLPGRSYTVDAANLDAATVAMAAFRSGTDRGIGIVPQSYFRNGPGIGVTPGLGFPASLVSEIEKDSASGVIFADTRTTSAHELAHTYRVDDNPMDPPKLVDGGYWVGADIGPRPAQRRDRAIGQTVSLMSIMGNESFPTNVRWIERNHYLQLMGEFQPNLAIDAARLANSVSQANATLMSLEAQSRTLLLAMIVGRNGTASMLPWFSTDHPPKTTEQPDGNFSLVMRDAFGTAVSSIRSNVDFHVYIDGFGAMEVDSAPVVLSVAYPTNVASVDLLLDERLIASVSPQGKVLTDTVRALPDEAFVDNPFQRRGALINKVEAFEKQVAHGALQGALQKLQNDITRDVQTQLRDDYHAPGPLQADKASLTVTLADVEARLNALLAAN